MLKGSSRCAVAWLVFHVPGFNLCAENVKCRPPECSVQTVIFSAIQGTRLRNNKFLSFITAWWVLRCQLRLSLASVKFSTAEIVLPVFVADGPFNAARNPHGYGVGRDILVDHGSGTNHSVISDGHSRKDRYVRSDPYVASDVNGDRIRVVMFSQDRQYGVSSGGNDHVRTEHAPVADEYFRVVHTGKVHIAIDSLTHMYVMEPPVRVGGNLHMAAFAEVGEHGFELGVLGW